MRNCGSRYRRRLLHRRQWPNRHRRRRRQLPRPRRSCRRHSKSPVAAAPATTPVPSATAVANTGGPWRAPQLPHGRFARHAGAIRRSGREPTGDPRRSSAAADSGACRSHDAGRVAPGGVTLDRADRRHSRAAAQDAVPEPESEPEPPVAVDVVHAAAGGGPARAVDRLHGPRPERPDADGLRRADAGDARRRDATGGGSCQLRRFPRAAPRRNSRTPRDPRRTGQVRLTWRATRTLSYTSS